MSAIADVTPSETPAMSWSFFEDTSFEIKNKIKDIVYHPSLNALLVYTNGNEISILDASSGSIFKTISLPAGSDGIKSIYLPSLERLVTFSGGVLSTRNEFNGVLLLENLLQQQVQNPDELVTVVLSLSDAIHLLDASTGSEPAGLEQVVEVLKDLEEEVFKVRVATKSNHREAKWATVCLRKPQSVLHKALTTILYDMKRLRTELPGFSVASSLVDQVSLFSSSSDLLNPLDASGGVDKGLMHNECVRRSTFRDWPHLDYKWALPTPMAQAGFYFHPNTAGNNGDDRAMCFICNVCLIYWEATDEPWSEHERHSPLCPFVKGEYTQNVPISATHATEPAKLHCLGEKITQVGSTTSERFFATVFDDSYVVVWDTNTFLKEHAIIHIKPKDFAISSAFKSEFQNVPAPSFSSSAEEASRGSKVEGRGQNVEGRKTNREGRQFGDILSCKASVSAVSVLKQPTESNLECAPSKPSNCKTFLIAGACLTFRYQGVETDKSNGPTDEGAVIRDHQPAVSDVVVLNRLNQEKNEENASEEQAHSSNGNDDNDPAVASGRVTAGFKSHECSTVDRLCLVVYEIGTQQKKDSMKTPGNSASSLSTQKPIHVHHKKSIADSYVSYATSQPPIMDLASVDDLYDDDQDIQIVGFTPPQNVLNAAVCEPPAAFKHSNSIINSNVSSAMGPGQSQGSSLNHKPPSSYSAQNLQDYLQRRALLCIPLPKKVCSSGMTCITDILPTQDGTRLFVSVGPKVDVRIGEENDSKKCSWTLLYKISDFKSGPLLEAEPTAVVQHDAVYTSACMLPSDAYQLLMYDDDDTGDDAAVFLQLEKGESSKYPSGSASRKSSDEESVKLEPTPAAVPSDYLMSIKSMYGSVLTLTSEGDAHLLSLTDLSVMANINCQMNQSTGRKDNFVSAVYCSGIDRICLATKSNQLKFFSLTPTDQGGTNAVPFPLDTSTSSDELKFENVDEEHQQASGFSPDVRTSNYSTPLVQTTLLAQKKLSASVLIGLRRLIYYKNVTPRFVSTVPPCWKEVVQEQQQRKHPQHLHQHGEGVQHTRTWKLQSESSALGDENLFELVLPKPTMIGHLLVRFSLSSSFHSLSPASPQPQIKVTLMKLNSKGGLGGKGRCLDDQVDFGLNTKDGRRNAECSNDDEYVEQLESRYKAKVVCGPIDICDFLDLTGIQGTVPMASKHLMKDLSKTLLLHFKTVNTSSSSSKVNSVFTFDSLQQQQQKKAAPASKSNWDSVVSGKPPSGPSSSMLGQSSKSKGGDLPMLNSQNGVTVQEISITIRKFKKFGGSMREQQGKIPFGRSVFGGRFAHLRRMNRIYMLENSSFHERLLEIIGGREKVSAVGSVRTVKLHLALDILIWIVNVTRDLSDVVKNAREVEGQGLMKLIQKGLIDVIKTCLLSSDRSLAHKCARFLAACLVHCGSSRKAVENCSLAQFQMSLLSSLISSLPQVLSTTSAGSVHWYFAMLNHVKHLDPSLATLCCGELLTRVADEYGKRSDELQSFLGTRLGLNGRPFDSDVFEIDPSLPGSPQGVQNRSQQSQQQASAAALGGGTYAGIVGGQSSYLYGSMLGGMPLNSGLSGGSQGVSSYLTSSLFPDEGVFKDIMYLLDLEKNFGAAGREAVVKNEHINRFMTGLLEAEPLHFTCHSVSDGTRMEELDATLPLAQSIAPSAMQPTAMIGLSDGLGGPMNFAPDVASVMVLDAATGVQVPLKSGQYGAVAVGSMVGSVEDSQLQQLHNKQLMLFKLQMQKKKLEQKLAETTKAIAAGGSSKQSGGASASGATGGESLLPPTPKNTPFYMTPPMTPPNEIFSNLFSSITLPEYQTGPGKGSNDPKLGGTSDESDSVNLGGQSSSKFSFAWHQTKNVFQTPTPYALVIDRVHSGARRFVVLDFGKPICLTDVLIPSCSDVASMSIDVWLNSERSDGQRLVESNDIWSTNLVMCDILPPPICRYLKITTIRRFGGNTGRSKVPIGSFYGRSFIVPWERISDVSLISLLSSSVNLSFLQQSEALLTPNERTQALTQLNIYMSLLEDIQCSYGLAKCRLTQLASALMQSQKGDRSTRSMLMAKGKYSAAEERVVQTYHKTVQLQIQLNLAKRAIHRLQQELGTSSQQPSDSLNFDLNNPQKVKKVLEALSTDTLRFMAEKLSEVLLGLSAGIPPAINLPLSAVIHAPFVEGLPHAQLLFSSLCILGSSRKLQTTCGILLAHVCGDLPWWGDFLGRIFVEFFSSDQKHMFPQDRLFVLMVLLGQKSLCSPSAGQVLESILSLLSRLLLPLFSQKENEKERVQNKIENIDMTLISWLLLFVSKSLDNVSSAAYLEDGERQAAGKDKDGSTRWIGSSPCLNNRWNFMQAEDVLSQTGSTPAPNSGAAKPVKGIMNSLKYSNRRRIYARIVQQKLNYPVKLGHQKKHLWKNDYYIPGYQFGKSGSSQDTLKKSKISALFKPPHAMKSVKVMPSKSSISLVDSEDETTPVIQPSGSGTKNSNYSNSIDNAENSANKVNQNVSNLKKLLSSIASCVGKKDGPGAVMVDGWDFQEWDPVSLVSRETCLTLVKGLSTLILSLDLMCHVDFFMVACKVLTRIMTSCKPTIQLSEVMNVREIERLLVLACGGDYSSGQKLCGGAWTSHIIICLLQDVLEAEKAGQLHMDTNNSNDCHNSTPDSEGALKFTCSLPTLQAVDSDDDDDDDEDTALDNNSAVPDLMADCKFDEQMSLLVDSLVQDMAGDEEMFVVPIVKDVNDDASIEAEVAKMNWGNIKSPFDGSENMDSISSWLYPSYTEPQKSDWKSVFDPADSYESSNPWMFSNSMVVQSSSQEQLPTNNNNKFSNNNNASTSFSKTMFQSKLPLPLFGTLMSSAAGKIPAMGAPNMFNQSLKVAPPPSDYTLPQGISLAVDSRLEQGLEFPAELKLKAILAMEGNHTQMCLLQPLPGDARKTTSVGKDAYMPNLSFPTQMCASVELLSTCFSKLFKNLHSHNKINLENLLDVWLTLNDSAASLVATDSDVICDSVHLSLAPIDDEAVASLLLYVVRSPYLNDHTWTQLLRCLTLVENYRGYFGMNYTSESEASDLLSDQNFSLVLQKFLSGSTRSHYPGSVSYKVGPLVVKAFHDFMTSSLRNSRGRRRGKLQDILLSIIASFSSPGGVFYSCVGPLDVQTTMVEDLTDLVDSIRAEPVRVGTATSNGGGSREEGCLDLRVCMEVISNVCSLARLHLSSVEPTVYKNVSETFSTTSPASRTCFAALAAQTSKEGDNNKIGLNSSAKVNTAGNSCRDSLILSLLKLVDQLIRLPLPPGYVPGGSTSPEDSRPCSDSGIVEPMKQKCSRGGLDPSTPDVANVSNNQTSSDALTDHRTSTPYPEENDVREMKSDFSPGVSQESNIYCVPDDQGMTDEQKSAGMFSDSYLFFPPSVNVTGGQSEHGSVQSAKLESQSPANKPCSHRNFIDLIGGGRGYEQRGVHARSKMVADVVLKKTEVMFDLYSSLSLCNSHVLTSLSSPAANFEDSYSGENPISIGDGVFKILCTLNAKATSIELVVKPLCNFLDTRVPFLESESPLSNLPECRALSEPLLIYTFRVLDCNPALQLFSDLGGIEVLCHNLVISNERAVSTDPSLISIMMQYFSCPKLMSSTNLKFHNSELSSEYLQNFAPIGTISSSSQVANTSNVLIQNTPPPRRARSAAWSYHFHPDETWVDLTVTLPFAILLKEVVIVPHFSSLDTCPDAVIIETSRDGVSASIPLSGPIFTAGLTNIRYRLPGAKIATSVTVRFHRPKDSGVLGLTQIMLLGNLALGPDLRLAYEANKSCTRRSVFDDYILKPNTEWVRLFHHCLTKSDIAFKTNVVLAAAFVPDLLKICVSLLLRAPVPEIETVLLSVGQHSLEAGIQLISILLGGHGRLYNKELEGCCTIPHAIVCGMTSESTTGILFNLCTYSDGSTLTRITALIDWLTTCARVATDCIDDVTSTDDVTSAYLSGPSVANIHCISAILWKMRRTATVENVVTREFIGLLYEWSNLLPVRTSIKRSVDSVICSACYLKPELFSILIDWMGLFVHQPIGSLQTDDTKSQQDHDYFYSSDAPLTDDVKADHRGNFPSVHHKHHHNLHATTTTSLFLTEWKLISLATISRAPRSLKYLEGAGFFDLVCRLLDEFFSNDISKRISPTSSCSAFSDRERFEAAATLIGLQRGSKVSTQQQLPANIVAPLVDFLAEVSQESLVKDWLGDQQNSSFWSSLLKSLCTRPSVSFQSSNGNNLLTHDQQLQLEASVIKLIANLISCHPKNQYNFSQTLLGTIKFMAAPTSVYSSPLPGFLRRLLLQTILEDEKLVVCIHSNNLNMTKRSTTSSSSTLFSHPHPRFGAGCHHRTLVVSLQSTLADVVSAISDYEALSTSHLMSEDNSSRSFKNHSFNKMSEAKKKPAVANSQGLNQAQSRSTGGKVDKAPASSSSSSLAPTNNTVVTLYHSLMPDQPLPAELTLSQLYTMLTERGGATGSSIIELSMVEWKFQLDQLNQRTDSLSVMSPFQILETPHYPSVLQVFSGAGGLALLAERLPLLCPEFVRQTSNLVDGSQPMKHQQQPPSSAIPGGFLPADWVNIELNEEIYEDPYEPPISPQFVHSKPPNQPASLPLQTPLSIPPHSLIAFGLFLRLPGYSEVLLKDRKKAQCLLRLVLGVTDDGNGGQILNSPVASSLPSLPFQVLKCLLNSSPLTTDDGVLLRRTCVDIGVVHLILACLSILGHHAPRQHIPGIYQEILKVASQSQLYMMASGSTGSSNSVSGAAGATSAAAGGGGTHTKTASDEKGQNYWAKGTGFGTGSTASSWDAEHALMRQKIEEEHVTCLLQVLASFINPKLSTSSSTENTNRPPHNITAGRNKAPFFATSSTSTSVSSNFDAQNLLPAPPDSSFSDAAGGSGSLPACLSLLFSQSCLLPALSSYLRNDSVLDMACHVPLYRALLELLQAIATCPSLIALLLPLHDLDEMDSSSSSSSSSSSAISTLLDKMKRCVDTYASRLRSNKNQSKEASDDESEGLAYLIKEIQDTSAIVNSAISEHLSATGTSLPREKKKDMSSASLLSPSSGATSQSLDEKYISVMKLLQYDTYKMVLEDEGVIKFTVPHHYEANVKAAGEVNNTIRARRLAQEAVTLSTSLPLSVDSSVFVRCDEDRLDVMKVLMTGPAGTPYSHGCFEFDVFFPTDYPNSPPLINLQTTGNHSIRFNPNLYNDGKVCLSIINTWHGRPEEKWSSQTSSFLQVLVSVQSLILVNEPYFNEPGYERSRGTPSGMASSREYDSNIRQATVKWAMLEMIKNPPPAFKQIVQWHFWLKKDEIQTQIEEWIADMETRVKDKRVGRNISQSLLSLKRHYSQLKEEFSKLAIPDSVSAWDEEEEEVEDGDENGDDDDDDDNENGISFEASEKSLH